MSELVHIVEGGLEQFQQHFDEIPSDPDLIHIVEWLIVVFWEVDPEDDDDNLQQLYQLLLMLLHPLSEDSHGRFALPLYIQQVGVIA